MTNIGHARLMTRCGCSRVMEIATPYPEYLHIPLLEDISSIRSRGADPALESGPVPARRFKLVRLEQNPVFKHEVGIYKEQL